MISTGCFIIQAGMALAFSQFARGHHMKMRISVTKYLAMIGVVLLFENVGIAQQMIHEMGNAEGFRELRWGDSIGKASEIYNDLYFEKYVILNSKEDPSKVYVRKYGEGMIHGVAFGSVEYWFRDGAFFQIRAVLRSKFGPRTLVTRAEDAFDTISNSLQHRYGKLSEYQVHYVTEFMAVVKEATWKTGISTITLKYEGPSENNEDLLILEIRKSFRGG
jgi:hypothetical protein